MKYDWFNRPEDLFRGTDFWMLNGDLSEEEIVHQLTEMKDKGVYSFIARTYLGLKSDYPGPQFKSRMRVIIDTSKRLGLKVFLQAGYMPEAVLGLPAEHALRYIYPVKPGEEDGRRVLCRHGEWVFVEHNSVTFLDMFDPLAMDHYLKVSYEEMWQEFSEEFGKTVLSVWVDEPSYNGSYLPWTPRLESLFRERWGYELADKLWMLYLDSEESGKVRYHYRVIMRDLLEENYFKKVGAWCHAHNLWFSGHLMAEDTLQSQIYRAKACMPYYRYFDIPGMDVLKADMNWVDDPIAASDPLGKRYVQYNTVMQVVSAAKQAGKKHILAEMYGVGGENFTFRNMTGMFDSFAACGINHRSVHGIFYTLHGRGKRAYPPHISYYQPFWPKYKNVTDYCARVSAFISEGCSQADIAVIHPLETAYMMYRGPLGDVPAGGEEIRQLDLTFVDLLTTLRSEHHEVDLADLASIRDMGRVENGKLCVGEMRYGTVILPHLRVVTSQLLTLLEELVEQGGRVLIYGQMPPLVDGVSTPEAFSRLAEAAEFVDSLSDLLDRLPGKDYSFCGVGAENLFINHRVCDDSDHFMVYNRDCAHELRLTFSQNNRVGLCRFDAYSGEVESYPCRVDGGVLSVEITVPAGGSVLLSTLKRCDSAPWEMPSASRWVMPSDGPWQVELGGDNVLFLEYCRYRKGDGEFSHKLPVLAVQRLLSAEEYCGPITLQFEVDTAAPLDGLSLAVEDPTEQMITVDGRVIDPHAIGYYWERSFEKLSVGSLEAGHHIIEVKREFRPLSRVTNALTQLFETRHGVELEPMYLLGRFAVRGHRCTSTNGCVVFERDFVLEPLPTSLTTRGELTADGLPFYVGELTLRKELTVPDGAELSCAKLRLEVMNAGCGELLVNGICVGDINRTPCELSVGEVLRHGVNTVEIKLYTTLYNIVGPFHRPQGNLGNTFGGGYKNPDAAWLSINTDNPGWEKKMTLFYPNWTDRYNVVPLGIRGVSLEF